MTFKVNDSWKAVWCSTAISPGHLKLILLLVETHPLSEASLPKSCQKMHYISVLKTFEDPVLGLSIMIYVPRVPCKRILNLLRGTFWHRKSDCDKPSCEIVCIQRKNTDSGTNARSSEKDGSNLSRITFKKQLKSTKKPIISLKHQRSRNSK